MKPCVVRAALFAQYAHRNQFRKSWGSAQPDPYILHPQRVVGLTLLNVDKLWHPTYTTTEMVCAAWLHDTIEDCGVSVELIMSIFGEGVTNLVDSLTYKDGYDKNAYLRGFQTKSREAIFLKVMERIDNLNDCGAAPDSWKANYVKGSEILYGIARDYLPAPISKMLKDSIDLVRT